MTAATVVAGLVVSLGAATAWAAPPSFYSADPELELGGTALVAWGDNSLGGTLIPDAARYGVDAVAAGAGHSLALKDGKVFAWGWNNAGQANVPTDALAGVSDVAAGTTHSLALKDGRVLAWGANLYGQTTVPATALSGVTDIAAGGNASIALTAAGRLIVWGDAIWPIECNALGCWEQQPAETLEGVVAADAVGGSRDGTDVYWLKNGNVDCFGVGRSDLNCDSWAGTDSGVSAFDAGWAGEHSLAIKNGGVVQNPTQDAPWLPTVPVEARSGVVKVAAAGDTSFALKDGRVLAWGRNDAGQVTGASLLTDVTQLVAGGNHVLAIRTLAKPARPTYVKTRPGLASLTVSWSAGDDGGSPITGFTVSGSSGGSCETATATSCVLTGLDNEVDYSVEVRAHTALGTSEPQGAHGFTARTPEAPTWSTLVPGDRQVSLGWDTPDDRGAPLTGYRVEYRAQGQTPWQIATADGASTTPSLTVGGLANGTGYEFRVAALNAVGQGAYSSISSPVVPRTIPGTPVGVSGVPGNGQVVVSWTGPNSDGGSPITGYTVTAAPGGRTCTTTGTTSCTVTGLTNGTAYTFTVRAANAAGTGAVSAASNPVTPRTVPGAPTGVTAVPGNGQVAVSWTGPADGGSPITGYTVTAQPGGRTCTTTVATSCMVTGLTNGTAYRFSVTAVNAAGTSYASALTAAVTPNVLPAAPTIVSAVPGDRQLAVSWTAPEPNGGSPITGYTVTANPGGKTCTTSGTTSCTLSGLVNGTGYTFTVRAANAAGPGAVSAASDPVTPRTVPDAPSDVTAVPGNAEVAVSWTAPDSDGGSPVAAYTVTAAPGGRTCTTANTTCLVDGLANGAAYTFTVTAVNAAGTGPASPPSAAVSPATVPDPPTGVTASAGAGQATVRWTAPTVTGGTPVSGYQVTATPGGRTCTTTGALTCWITGLTNGTRYTFTVTAANAAGRGLPSAPSAAVTPRTVPAAPTAVTATTVTTSPTQASATVRWRPPASNGGSPVTGYKVAIWPSGRAVFTSSTTLTWAGLTPGATYTFTVTAFNAVGASLRPAKSAPVTPKRPVVGVKVKAVSNASKLYVDVNPDKGSGYWTFRVQYKTSSGWKTRSTTYTTTGTTETRTIDLGKGTYRVLVAGKYGYLGATSQPVSLRK